MPGMLWWGKGNKRGAIQLVFVLLLMGWPGLAAGGYSVDHPPVITGAKPDPLVSRERSADDIYVTIYGQNFWLSGPNDPDRREGFIRRRGQSDWQKVQGVSIMNDRYTVRFLVSPMLNGAGTLEFMLKIDGSASNIYAVQIVAEPPLLDWIAPVKITAGGAADDPRWTMRLSGSRWIEPTTVWIDGVYEGALNLRMTEMKISWPPSHRAVGRHPVQLRTIHGGSETRIVEIVAPIQKNSVDTRMVAPDMKLKLQPKAAVRNTIPSTVPAALRPAPPPATVYVRPQFKPAQIPDPVK
jgi:hypothetical protein